MGASVVRCEDATERTVSHARMVGQGRAAQRAVEQACSQACRVAVRYVCATRALKCVPSRRQACRVSRRAPLSASPEVHRDAGRCCRTSGAPRDRCWVARGHHDRAEYPICEPFQTAILLVVTVTSTSRPTRSIADFAFGCPVASVASWSSPSRTPRQPHITKPCPPRSPTRSRSRLRARLPR